MLKQEIHYIDFDDRPQVDIAYFNLSKAEVARWELESSMFTSDGDTITSSSGGITEQIRGVIASGQGKKIMELTEELLRRAYGVRSSDMKSFNKKPELFEAFQQTAAYDQLFLDLVTNAEFSANFINGVLRSALADRDKPDAPVRAPSAPLPQRVPGEALGAAQQPQVYGTPEGSVVSTTVDQMTEEELRAFAAKHLA